MNLSNYLGEGISKNVNYKNVLNLSSLQSILILFYYYYIATQFHPPPHLTQGEGGLMFQNLTRIGGLQKWWEVQQGSSSNFYRDSHNVNYYQLEPVSSFCFFKKQTASFLPVTFQALIFSFNISDGEFYFIYCTCLSIALDKAVLIEQKLLLIALLPCSHVIVT